MTEKNFYITTPIYYVNGTPHIGHAYTTLACDTMARFKRLDGCKVKFLTGTDEHGLKVEKAAQKENIDPQEFADKVSEEFRKLTKKMQFQYDDFIRTTEDRHKKAAQFLWKRLEENNQIYLNHYKGWYAVRDEAYYAESELTTLDNGKKIAPTGAEVEWVEEPSYFFKLSEWQEPLLKFYKENPDFVFPKARMNEVMSFVEGGLKDLSISRTSFKWGIPVPDAPDHVMYVWMDALTNYITALGFPDEEAQQYKDFWPANLHMVGKDILRFHAVYWPAFLMAAGLKPPQQIVVHGLWLMNDEKMSKSIGNVISPDKLIEDYGLDTLRYYLLREVPFGNDGDFSQKSLVTRMNSELANDLGNLVQRVMSFIYKHSDQKIPEKGEFNQTDKEFLDKIYGLLPKVRENIDKYAFHRALEVIWSGCNEANRYIDEQAPWVLRKEDVARMGTVLYILAESIRNIALLLLPFMPESSNKILAQLNIDDNERNFENIGHQSSLSSGMAIPKPEGIFPRFIETKD